MKYRIKKGRPDRSGNIRITPEFRDEPDIEKFGRALIAVALRIMEEKTAGEKGDDMT